MQSPRREMPPGEHVGEAEPHDIRAADREAHPGIREERSLVEPALFGAPYFYTVFTQARAQSAALSSDSCAPMTTVSTFTAGGTKPLIRRRCAL